jgi:hypothetical protein
MAHEPHEHNTLISDLATCKQQESEGYVLDTLCAVMKYARMYLYIYFLK